MHADPAAVAVRKPKFKKSVAREYLESIVVAVILALFIRTFAIQAFKIPTASMQPNLLIGDHLLVNKVIYSPSFSPLEDRLLGKRAIRRGDVVVFKYPEQPWRDFIKRVVGLPGETIQVRDKTVYVDGKPLDEPYAHFLDEPLRPGDSEFGFTSVRVREDYGPRTVPPGHLLVLGDNRDNSSDGRVWGFLPRDQVRGRALLVYWSYDSGAFAWTRWDRFFHVIR